MPTQKKINKGTSHVGYGKARLVEKNIQKMQITLYLNKELDKLFFTE